MSIGGIEKDAEEEIEVGTEKVEAAGKETGGNQETEGGHGPVNRDALLATDHFYDPSLNIIYVIGRIHGTVEIVEGINLAGLNFFFLNLNFFYFIFFIFYLNFYLFFYFSLFSYLYHFIFFLFFFIFIDFFY